jgi:hypothetical protein
MLMNSVVYPIEGCYSATEMNNLLMYPTMWMVLNSAMLKEARLQGLPAV